MVVATFSLVWEGNKYLELDILIDGIDDLPLYPT